MNVVLSPPWRGLGIPTVIEAVARRDPDAALFAEIDPDAADGAVHREIANAALRDRVALCAARLAALRLRPGDRLALLVAPSIDFVVALAGALRAGLEPVLLPLSLDPATHGGVVSELNVAGVLAGRRLDGLDLPRRARDLAASQFSIRTAATLDPAPIDGLVSLDGVEADGSVRMAETAGQILTMETRDREVRAYARSQDMLIAEALAFIAVAQVKAGSEILSSLASGSGFQVASGLMAPLLCRARASFLPRPTGRALAAMLKRAAKGAVLVLPGELEQQLPPGLLASAGIGAVVYRHNDVSRSGRSAGSDPAAGIRICDATLIGEAASYLLPRLSQGRRAPLPLNWRQPGLRIVEDDRLLVQAEIAADGQLRLDGYGVARPPGQRSGPVSTGLVATATANQTFEPNAVRAAGAAA
jgi:hypothetical protein